MSGEFFDHRKPIERARGSVMQEVQANQTTVEPAVRHSRALMSTIMREWLTATIYDGHRRYHVMNLEGTAENSYIRYMKVLPILSKGAICLVL